MPKVSRCDRGLKVPTALAKQDLTCVTTKLLKVSVCKRLNFCLEDSGSIQSRLKGVGM